MRTFWSYALTLGLAPLPFVQPSALETSANANDTRQNATLGMRLTVVEQALESALNDYITKWQICAANHKLYHATSPQGDVNKCIDISVMKCARVGKEWDPTDPARDANGCIDRGGGATIPAGAVMAFDLASCPSGWSAFTRTAGRFVVGVGSLSGESYSLRETGGVAMTNLLAANLPHHSHQHSDWKTDRGLIAEYKTQTYGPDAPENQTRTTDNCDACVGTDFENRPPFVALLYCEKN